jgi:hypothetical protein
MKAAYMRPAPEKLDPAILFKETNVDVRRELLRRIGVSRLFQFGTVVETVGDYVLVDMAPFLNKIRTEGIVDEQNRRARRGMADTGTIMYAPYLYMKNPSVEGVYHLEGVSPQCHTVKAAINWRANQISYVDWEPYMLS